MVIFNQNIDYLYTDGWHPTVNPSSRMPIYYLRHKKLFPDNPIVLNEFPRSKGGVTFRFLRFSKTAFPQQTLVKIQKPLFEFMPWWLPSTLSENFLFHIYEDVLSNNIGLSKVELNCIEEFYNELKRRASEEMSIGELLNLVNFDKYKSIFPDLPKIKCTGFSKSIFKDIFNETLIIHRDIFFYILNQICQKHKIKYLNKIAFCNDSDFSIYRISYLASDEYFYKSMIDVKTGERIGAKLIYSYENFVLDIRNGNSVLSSKISCIIEMLSSASASNKRFFHFGNTYNIFGEIETIILQSPTGNPPKISVGYLKDYEDSWNYAFLRFNKDYPIHLFDILPLRDQVVFQKINLIAKKSLEIREPIYIPSKNSLSDSINSVIV